jgi:hypothetical protein
VVPSSNVTVQLPTKWDGEISKMLQRHQEQPAVLAHVVFRQEPDDSQPGPEDAQHRLQLMASVIVTIREDSWSLRPDRVLRRISRERTASKSSTSAFFR